MVKCLSLRVAFLFCFVFILASYRFENEIFCPFFHLPNSPPPRKRQALWKSLQCTDAKCPKVKLQLQAEERGVVSIKGVSANRFLAMKEDGRLLALKCATEECFFFERLESNNYNTYRSRKYSDWYVALKRTGQYKPGPKTGPGQKAILFLPMSAKS
uniref:Fibroblast growth factor n=1 Tax=Dromaius novaehollandiae TaxID=8790 RepID=A0A8C4JUB3_DRONO